MKKRQFRFLSLFLTALTLALSLSCAFVPRACAAAADVVPAGLLEDLQFAVSTGATQVDVASYKVELSEKTKSAISASVFDETPELFYVEAPLTFAYNPQNNQIMQILVDYRLTPEEYTEQIDAVEEAADELLEGIAGNGALSDVQKALLVHDRLAVLCEYDAAVNTKEGAGPNVRNLYGVLVEHKAVCEGYARAYNYLLAKVGIRCEKVDSDQLNHSWNMVYIDGKPYHVDVTRDDPMPDRTGLVCHNYFLLSSEALYREGHVAKDYDTSPKDTKYDNAFWRNSFSPFVMARGVIFYIDSADGALMTYDRKKLLSIPDSWGYSEGTRKFRCLSRLATDGTDLFYNGTKDVLRYDIGTGKTEKVFSPADTSGKKLIFGFTWRNGRFICDFMESPDRYEMEEKSAYQVTKAYAAHVHTWDKGKVVDDGTVSGVKKTDYTCTVCGAIHIEETTVAKQGPAPGDVNGDGEVTAADARLALRASVGLEKEIRKGTDAFTASDVNRDGVIGADDARLILRASVRLENLSSLGK